MLYLFMMIDRFLYYDDFNITGYTLDFNLTWPFVRQAKKCLHIALYKSWNMTKDVSLYGHNAMPYFCLSGLNLSELTKFTIYYHGL